MCLYVILCGSQKNQSLQSCALISWYMTSIHSTLETKPFKTSDLTCTVSVFVWNVLKEKVGLWNRLLENTEVDVMFAVYYFLCSTTALWLPISHRCTRGSELSVAHSDSLKWPHVKKCQTVPMVPGEPAVGVWNKSTRRGTEQAERAYQETPPSSPFDLSPFVTADLCDQSESLDRSELCLLFNCSRDRWHNDLPESICSGVISSPPAEWCAL